MFQKEHPENYIRPFFKIFVEDKTHHSLKGMHPPFLSIPGAEAEVEAEAEANPGAGVEVATNNLPEEVFKVSKINQTEVHTRTITKEIIQTGVPPQTLTKEETKTREEVDPTDIDNQKSVQRLVHTLKSYVARFPKKLMVLDLVNMYIKTQAYTIQRLSLSAHQDYILHGGRISWFREAWKEMGADSFVLEMLRCGYRPLFKHHPPPLTSLPFPFEICKHPLQPIIPHIQDMLDKGAIEVVNKIHSPGLYCHLFTAPKKSGGTRPVINLKVLNRTLKIPTFKMLTVQQLMNSVQPGEYAASLDLKDAYFHLKMHKGFRKYLRFCCQGQVYQFKALPFGLATAPRVFTMLIRPLAQLLHTLGIDFSYFLDDWLIKAPTLQLVLLGMRITVLWCAQTGLVINFNKSELDPLQDFRFIGVRFDTKEGKCYPPEERLAKLEQLATVMLLLKRPPVRSVQSLLGVMASAEKQIPYARFHMRSIQADLHNQYRYGRHLQSKTIILSPLSKEDLKWWLNRENTAVGVPLGQFVPEVQLMTDSSLTEWGAQIVNGPSFTQKWSTKWQEMSINVLEMEAVYRALVQFSPQCKGKKVLVLSDNTATTYYINKQGGTRAPLMMESARKLFNEAINKRVSLKARHIPGKLNVLADGLSRTTEIISTEWTLSKAILGLVWKHWHCPNIDLFATRFNNRLPVYVSPCPDNQAYAIDAMSIPWGNLDAYAYPPVVMLPAVLAKIKKDRARVILIAPKWPSQRWYPTLLDLLVDEPFPLPAHPKMLKQSLNRHFHHNPAMLCLHAWKLSGIN